MKQRKRTKGILSWILVLSMLMSMLSTVGMKEVQAAATPTYFKAYKKAAYETTSPDFEVTVSGNKLDVVQYFEGRYSYAHLSYEGTATFEIKALYGNIESYNISPHSYGVEAKVDGNKLTFDLEQKNSRYLIMDITAGGKKKQLVIAADPKLDIEEPGADGKPVINIKERGIVEGEKGDGSDNSAIIQKAINELSDNGGGTLYFPEGWYKFVTIDAKNNVTLYLDDNAYLRGSGDRTEYSWSDSGSNGRQVKRRDILIQDTKNFSIIGTGMIDANSCILALPQDADGGTTKVPDTPQGDYYPTGWDDFRKGIVDGNNADGIRFEGVTFKDATGWTFSINSCNNINIKNVKMLNDYEVVHSDGYDICAGQDVLISECLGLCGDDVFCPKGNNSKRDMKNYLIENGVAYACGGAGCKIGVQAESKTYNIEFNNIDVVQGYRGFSVSRDEGNGDWSDIRFINIRVERIFVESNPMDTGQYRPAPFVIWAVQKNAKVGNVSNIEVTNCSIEDCSGIKAVMKGETTPEGKKGVVSDVRFTNLVMEGRTITKENWKRKFTVSGNVEQDTVTFTNTEILTPKISVYEAETADKDGANYTKSTDCSGRFYAGNIGKINGKNNTVTFTVYADSAGEYDMNVYSCTSEARSFFVSANGQEQELKCNGDSFSKPGEVKTIKINLKAGENKVTFGNPNNPAPNLDKIELVEKEPETFTMLEAEKAELSNGAKVSDAAACSNGSQVGYVGGANNGTITFKVTAYEAGKRTLKIYYSSEQNRKIGVKVNGGNIISLDTGKTSSWTTPCDVPVMTEVELKQGENLIQLMGVDGEEAPNIDQIAIEEEQVNEVEGVDFAIEAEAGTLSGSAKIESTADDSNVYQVTNIGGEGAGAVTFNVKSETTGKRNLKIYYDAESASELNVLVNGVVVDTIKCTETSATTPNAGVVEVEVGLQVGDNTIQLAGAGTAAAPNIDKVSLRLTETETVTLVNDMISKIPEKVTQADKATVLAIKAAYESLGDKSGVTNADKLQEAITNVDKKPVESVKLNYTSLVMSEGDTKTLEAVITPDDATNKNLIWKSDKEDVVTVENGSLIAKKAGVANITVTSEDGSKTATCVVTVLETTVEKNIYTVDFVVNDTTTSVQVFEGEKVEKQADPVVAGYTFDGWYDGDNLFDFDKEVITKNITLVAKFIKIEAGGVIDDKETLKEALDNAIEKAASVYEEGQSDYTEESWQAFVDAYNKANVPVDDKTTEELQILLGNLENAQNNLNKKVNIGDGTNEDDSQGGNTGENPDGTTGDNSQGDNTGENPDGTTGDDSQGGNTGDNPDGTTGDDSQGGNTGENPDGITGDDSQGGNTGENPDGTTGDDSQGGNTGENPDGTTGDDSQGGNAGENPDGTTGDNTQSGNQIESTGNNSQTENIQNGSTGGNAQNGNTQNGLQAGNTAGIMVNDIQLKGFSKKIAVNGKIRLNATVLPDNATNSAVVWSVSDERYASVSQSGLVKTKKAGKGKSVTVTATAADGSGEFATYTIQIMPKAVKKIILVAKNKVVKAGKSVKITAIVNPLASTSKINKTLEWSSSNTKYATVTKNGVVKTKKAGAGKKVRITAKSTDGTDKKQTITLTIK